MISLQYVILAGSLLYFSSVLPISPVHVVMIICAPIFLVYILLKKKKALPKKALCVFPLAVASLPQLLLSSPSLVINWYVSVLFFALSAYCAWSISRISLKPIDVFVVFAASIGLLDGVYRLLNPDLTLPIHRLAELGIQFQIYKTNSFMFLDSNFVGLLLVFSFSVFLWRRRICPTNSKLFSVALFSIFCLSIFLSFSRAAYMSGIFAIFLYCLSGMKRSVVLALLLTLLPIFFLLVYRLFIEDISFLSKIYILDKTQDLLFKSNISEVLFGVGIGNAVNVMGIGAHNILSIAIIELGLIVALIYGLTLSYFLLKIRHGYLLILPFLLCSMSVSSTAIAYLFAVFGFVLIFETKTMRLS